MDYILNENLFINIKEEYKYFIYKIITKTGTVSNKELNGIKIIEKNIKSRINKWFLF